MTRAATGVLLCLLIAGCGGAQTTTDDPGGGTRTVTHAAGVSEVPQDPERVVTLGGLYTAAALAVGVVPVAVGDSDARELSVYDELLPADVDLAGLPTVGDPYAPNAEALLAAEPDLLLGDEFQEQYDQLAEIAPTVLVRYRSNGGWRERFPDLAEALGRSDRVAEVDGAYQADLDSLPDAAREQTTAFVRADPGGAFRVDGLAAAFAGSVAEDAGIPSLVPEGLGELEEDSGFLTLSAENLGVLADADRIVLGDNSFYDAELEDSLSILARNPLWDRLPAVQAGRVLQVPGPIYNGGNHYAARLLLRALAEG